MDAWIIEYLNAVTFMASDNDIFETMRTYETPLFDKLVRTLLHDNFSIAWKALTVVTNLTAMTDNWFVEAFEKRGILAVLSKCFGCDKTFKNDLLRTFMNLFIGSDSIANAIAADHNLLFRIMRMSQENPDIDDAVLAFFNVLFNDPVPSQLVKFALTNSEIVDFFLAKVTPKTSSSLLGKIGNIVRRLIVIAERVAESFPDGQNLIINRINQNEGLQRMVDIAEKAKNAQIRNLYQHILVEFFHELIELDTDSDQADY